MDNPFTKGWWGNGYIPSVSHPELDLPQQSWSPSEYQPIANPPISNIQLTLKKFDQSSGIATYEMVTSNPPLDFAQYLNNVVIDSGSGQKSLTKNISTAATVGFEFHLDVANGEFSIERKRFEAGWRSARFFDDVYFSRNAGAQSYFNQYAHAVQAKRGLNGWTVDLSYSEPWEGDIGKPADRWTVKTEGHIYEQGDLRATGIKWNSSLGGITVEYFANTVLDRASTAAVYWAKGPTVNDRITSDPIIEFPLPKGAILGSKNINVPGIQLREAPLGTTHILFVLDPDDFAAESREDNNVIAIEDVVIVFNKKRAREDVVTDYARTIIKDAARYAGQHGVYITRTFSTIKRQAEIMYDLLSGELPKKVRDEKGHNTTQSWIRSMYSRSDPKGIVVKAYEDALESGKKSEAEIVPDMVAAIESVKEDGKADAFRHTWNPEIVMVIDIANIARVKEGNFTIVNKERFYQATDKKFDPRISHRMSPLNKPGETFDKAFHLEIPKIFEIGLSESNDDANLDRTEDFIPYDEETQTEVRSNDENANTSLSADARIDFKLFSSAECSVSTGPYIYKFHASKGDLVSIGIEVQSVYQGSEWQDDDTVLFVFDASGSLVAENDLADPSHSDYQSELAGIDIPRDGMYFVVVGTFGLRPLFDDQEILTGWLEEGGSSVDCRVDFARHPAGFSMEKTGGRMISIHCPEGVTLQRSDSPVGPWEEEIEDSPQFFDAAEGPVFFKLNNSTEEVNNW